MELEGDFISWLRSEAKLKKKSVVHCGIGDDCAVIDRGDVFEIIENDVITEGNHFLPKWSSPQEIGMKAIESNVSDIASMGGVPKFVVIGVTMPNDVDLSYLQSVYKGILCACKKYSIELVGGDTTSGQSMTISVTMIGEVEKSKIIYRSGAKAGDILALSGSCGASMAGFRLLKVLDEQGLSLNEFLSTFPLSDRHAICFCIEKHLRPEARLDVGGLLADMGVHAMIDVSDGVASEARHLAFESGLSVQIDESLIQIDSRVIRVARLLNEDPLSFVLSGGEDFELMFACTRKLFRDVKKKLESLKIDVPQMIGALQKHGCLHDEFRYTILKKSGRLEELPFGYLHFKV